MAPHFKKLTDCPENLREAIDWLIQIKNGGDGQGLERLAKALKKLIEGAIAKAEKSFERREKQLNCGYPSSSVTKYCEEQDAEIQKLKDSQISSDDSKLLKLESDLQKHRDDDHYLSVEARQRALDDIKNRRDSLRELEKKLEPLIGKKGKKDYKQTKDVLENLCSGLETFLGFNSETKRYTGKGIVYSDLDRLCDAVMGFLYQVIKDVHENRNLSPYKGELKSVVEALSIHRNNGEKGLQIVIEPVKRGIAGWLAAVNLSNKNVTGPLTALENEVSAEMERIINIEGLDYNDFAMGILKSWIKSVLQLPWKSDESYEKLKAIDDNLKKSLDSHVSVVNQAVQDFCDNAFSDRKGLAEVCRKVDGEFQALDKMVADGVGEEIGLKKQLKDEIEALKNNVEKKHPTELRASIDLGKKTLTAAKEAADAYLKQYDSKIRDHFTKKFEGIEQLLHEIDKSKNTLGRPQPATNSKLREEVSALTSMIDEMETQVQEGAKGIGNAINTAVNRVNHALGTLDGKVKDGLERVKQQIHPEVTKVIEALKRGIRSAAEDASDTLGHRRGPAGAQEIIQKFQGVLNDEAPMLNDWVQVAQLNGLQNAMAALDQRMDNLNTDEFKSFKGFLKHLMKGVVSTRLNGVQPTTLFDALTHDIKRKVGDKLQSIKKSGTFELVFTNYHQWVSTNTGNTLKAEVDNIKTTLQPFFKEADIGEKSTFNLEEGGQFGNYHKTRREAEQAIQDALTKITNLENIPIAVEVAKTKVEEFIKEIKEKFELLKGKVESTIETLTNAGEQLTQMIREINSEIDEFHNKAKRYIGEFHSAYKRASKQASTNIQKSALYNFAKSKVAGLQKLKELVDKENKNIAEIIENDSKSGLKGLMKAMQTHEGSLDGIKDLINLTHTQHPSTTDHQFQRLVDKSQSYLNIILEYIEGQVKVRKSDGRGEENKISGKLCVIQGILNKLIGRINREKHFDSSFTGYLEDLNESLSELQPSAFNGYYHPELSDALKKGLTNFTAVLQKAYISKYDGSLPITNWEETDGTYPEVIKLTADSDNIAKVCITIIPIIFAVLQKLRTKCSVDSGVSWKALRINKSTQLGEFLGRQGYEVSELGRQNGELHDNDNTNGSTISNLLLNKANSVFNKTHKAPIVNLHRHLHAYYQVCHVLVSSTTRYPCNIYEMLLWLSGLRYNRILEKVGQHVKGLFRKPENKKEIDDYSKYIVHASPNAFNASDSIGAVIDVCQQAEALLITILGTGNAETVYAVDYCTNALNLTYPSSGENAFAALLAILRKVFAVLKFLHIRCSTPSSEYGWADCLYGKDVPTTKSQCNEQSTNKAVCRANCQPTSPLMCYLNDCLPGHLPHHLMTVGCKSECKTCPVTPNGMACLTPLGFRGFSGSTKMGKEISTILESMFTDEYLTPLWSLAPKPPTTLSEHFSFALCLGNRFVHSSASNKNTIQYKIQDSIRKQSINLYGRPGDLTDAVIDAYGNSHNIHSNTHPANVSSLLMPTSCVGEHCGPYLQSLFANDYQYMVLQHSNTYLSWAIYLPWTFWDLLNHLYNAFCSINCQDWGCRGCLRGDKCKKGEHGVVDEEKKSAICQCTSIVDCKGVAPTLYQFGFVFGEASTLNDNTSPKKCSDFCSQLKNVLKSEYFQKLFEECDNFLWKIREPFSYLVLSLWLLSLLYLIHIMVIRLDLLHIKSHLHSPSSHRIAAQSLLAGVRVGKLAKLTYLQP